ncbi:MAG: ABC transporter permease [Chloroflexi bacterium]|nr:ABC transporter permease [Chloroflexota bacterium]
MNLSRIFLTTLFSLWLAASLAFFALRVLPGDAISAQLANVPVSAAELEARRKAMGLDEPYLQQYWVYWRQLARGDFGNSLLDGLPVMELITPRLLPSATLALAAIVVSACLGIIIGIAAASSGSKTIRQLAKGLTGLSLSIPIFGLATAALWVTTAGVSPVWRRFWLPVFVLGFSGMGSIAKLLTSEIQSVMRADYIWVARAKGLSNLRILWVHVLRIVMLPTISLIAIQLGWLMGGALMTEIIFNRPGLGRLLFERTIHQDYAVVQALVLFMTAVYILVNSAAEMLFRLLDPRIRL